MPDMQRRAGAVVAHIGGDRAFAEPRIQPFRIGALMDVAALVEDAQEVGTEAGHGSVDTVTIDLGALGS